MDPNDMRLWNPETHEPYRIPFICPLCKQLRSGSDMVIPGHILKLVYCKHCNRCKRLFTKSQWHRYKEEAKINSV